MFADLVPFRVEDLPTLLNRFKFHSTVEVSKMKSTVYLSYYLGPRGLNATHYLQEDDYVNRDYLLDYSEFYSKCFTDRYNRKCCRIHFFKINPEQGEVKDIWTEALLNKKDHESFWDQSYLGFVVVKPIPFSLIGFSVLKNFNYFEDPALYCKSRDYWSTKKCKVNLLGTDVEIESLPFIQQDSVLAACASVSIWTVFQKASESSFVVQKSPGQITKDAADVNSDGGRLIPNDGLDIPDMCAAITKNGLDTVVYNTKAPTLLDTNSERDLSFRARKRRRQRHDHENLEFCSLIKKIVFAYSDLGNPIILGLSVPRGNIRSEHAVAISGHNLADGNHHSIWKAERIDKFYVHDDQLGPFSKVRFKKTGQLITSWDLFEFAEQRGLDFDLGAKIPDKVDCTEALALIVPVFPKVRLTYAPVEDIVFVFNDIFNLKLGDQFIDSLEWEIKVRQSKEFKAEIRDSGLFDLENIHDYDQLTNILSKSMPRYVWNAVGRMKDIRIFDILFDATDFSHGILGEAFYCYSNEIFESLKQGIESDFQAIINDYSFKDKLFREDYLKLFCNNNLISNT